MSIQWGKLGKHVLTLGIGYAIERLVAKRVPQTLAELLDSLARGNAEKVPPELQAALDALMRAKFDEQLTKLQAASAQLEESFERAAKLADATAKGDTVEAARLLRDTVRGKG
jgi:thioredoxin-like negative regulator of GroEL